MIALYLFSLIGCMFIGSFVMYSAYLANEQKRVVQFRQRSMERRHQRQPLAVQLRRFVPYALSNC